MTKPNPPLRECLLHGLLAAQGENWVKLTLVENPALRLVVRDQAKDCRQCQAEIDKLFPDGLPVSEPADVDPATIDKMVAELEEELATWPNEQNQPPESGGNQHGG